MATAPPPQGSGVHHCPRKSNFENALERVFYGAWMQSVNEEALHNARLQSFHLIELHYGFIKHFHS